MRTERPTSLDAGLAADILLAGVRTHKLTICGLWGYNALIGNDPKRSHRNIDDPDQKSRMESAFHQVFAAMYREGILPMPDAPKPVLPVGKFRKKPVVIDAFLWTGTNPFELGLWRAQWPRTFSDLHIHEDMTVDIMTLEDGPDGRAKHVASMGDYIIRGVKGEFYACKPDIFEMTYEMPVCR